MGNEIITTICGNLVDDPSLRFTPSGAAVANFTIASTPRRFDKDAGQWVDGDPVFMRCSLWRDAAENTAESLTKGMRVIAIGKLIQRSYETKEGEKRTVVELEVDEVGPSLKFATARVTKASRGGSGGDWAQPRPRSGGRNGDAWDASTGAGGWGSNGPSRGQAPF